QQPSKNSEGTYSATADASHVCLGSTLADVQRFHYARSAQAANLDASVRNQGLPQVALAAHQLD
ncbi:MAG TPA: hypothetical protein VIY49_20645, partial [Bryobacteraceae bacterium]